MERQGCTCLFFIKKIYGEENALYETYQNQPRTPRGKGTSFYGIRVMAAIRSATRIPFFIMYGGVTAGYRYG